MSRFQTVFLSGVLACNLTLALTAAVYALSPEAGIAQFDPSVRNAQRRIAVAEARTAQLQAETRPLLVRLGCGGVDLNDTAAAMACIQRRADLDVAAIRASLDRVQAGVH